MAASKLLLVASSFSKDTEQSYAASLRVAVRNSAARLLLVLRLEYFRYYLQLNDAEDSA
jgi:hypothetical protein